MSYEGWAIVELMGHRRYGGKVSNAEMYGGSFLRIDVFGIGDDEPLATQFYGAQSIYCLTPVTEETARALGERAKPAPVQRWELPSPSDVDHNDNDEMRWEE